jgi:hypothetical protein
MTDGAVVEECANCDYRITYYPRANELKMELDKIEDK